MSIIFDSKDTRDNKDSLASLSRLSKTMDRKGSRVLGGLAAKIRPDSPTTIEACKELGVLVEELE